MIIFSFAIYL